MEQALNATFERAAATAARLAANVATVVEGKDEQIRLILAALACRGHVLLEDVPGTAKTVLARALAGSIEGATVSRIQCTPDLQPTDITGLSVWNPNTREFEFRPGPIFANVLVVDEVNRALPKAQSALLEGMAEHQVTVDGVTHPLPDPFFVDRDGEHDRAGGDVPAPRGPARPLPDPHLARLPVARRGADDRRRAAARASARAPPACHRRSTSSPTLFAAVEEIYIDPLLKRWAVELVRGDASARRGRDRRLGARQPGARADGTRLGARRRARRSSSRRTSSGSSAPSSATG